VWHMTGARHTHRQALCKLLKHNFSPCEECNKHVILMVRTSHHMSSAKYMRYVCNATLRQGDKERVILRQRVRGSVRAVRGVRNIPVFLTETTAAADAKGTCMPICVLMQPNYDIIHLQSKVGIRTFKLY